MIGMVGYRATMDPDLEHAHGFGSSRRAALRRGLMAVAAGAVAPLMLARRAFGAGVAPGLGVQIGAGAGAGRGAESDGLRRSLDPADPILHLTDAALGPTQTIHGLPFASRWHGDWFGPSRLPFHNPPVYDGPIAPDEEVSVAIIGGGLSGLATGALLALRDPTVDVAVFDLRPRLGGNAIGESWRGVPYSLGSAYFMVPDKGSVEDNLYTSLGLYDQARLDEGEGFRVEFGGKIVKDLCMDCTPEQLTALAHYERAVHTYANETFPDIPLDPASEKLVLELDQYTLKGHVEMLTGGEGAMPPLVADAIQAYCYSSFGVGWEELNAAAGWNFIAAEEFGRLVMPGGNAGLARELWRAMKRAEAGRNRGGSVGVNQLPMARLSAQVVNVKFESGSRAVLITWIDRHGRVRLTRAQHAVYCGSKFIARHIMPDMAAWDAGKEYATHQVPTTAYLVANVLLKKPAPANFYDIFMVHDDAFPDEGAGMEFDRRITDALAGSFTNGPRKDADVLTLYWPLPWHTARFTAVKDGDWRTYAEIGAPQIKRVLDLMGLATDDVMQVRIARWGHAMPFMSQGFLSSGYGEALRRPIEGRLHFVNQDNWALPAWENSLLDADAAVTEILG